MSHCLSSIFDPFLYGQKAVEQFFIRDKRLIFYEVNIMLFVEYPKCTTCQKAKKWLTENGVAFEDRNIKEENPTYEELAEWYRKSALPLKKFFNTSGLLYKSMGLKDKLPSMTEDEMLRLLASDGMLIKRPIAVDGDTVLVGFREEAWSTLK